MGLLGCYFTTYHFNNYFALPLFLLIFTNACKCANYCPTGMMSLFNGASCSNDQTCQSLATGFFCYQGRCCAQNSAPQGGYGSSCTQDGQCLLINLQCMNNVCYCRAGYSYDGLECRTLVAYDSGMNFHTSSTCSPDQLPYNGMCYSYSSFGGTCEFSRQCNYPGGICQLRRCICPTGQIYDGFRCINDPNIPITRVLFVPPPPPAFTVHCLPNEVNVDGKCFQKRLLGQPCNFHQQCQSSNGEIVDCVQSICTLCEPINNNINNNFGAVAPMYNDGYAIQVPCGTNQVRINGQCLPIVNAGEPCLYDLQCRSPYLDRGMYCGNYVCQFSTNFIWNPSPNEINFPTCRNPSAEVELSSAIPKDCIYQRCSPGFHCEYNSVYKGGQYICCGTSALNPVYGQPKMYPGYTNLPLQCTAINSCTFVDFPYCVYSESYRHKVCCSKPQCL